MMSADSVSCCCKEQGGLKWFKKQKIMILIKMDPYSDASITYGLQMGPEIFYRMFSRLVSYETIFAHSADSR